ncbi:two component transcriptional regulator, winged helix family [Alkaliphilus metalliredigens QYMF]|uniref:Stage 0 sporulation protein A homolog n=1 Tax=Alkaliphilus metalliredigens (strain QYMF) TaxID=293826 RepID=A6TT29_ALKMQ|nr:response regulator transcription factor [Alkaliphilus metalliredigens]ABR49347.1 two component transcriptional regulator, winged helix family [Alkaliphilus metalliredigens QYMF]
MVGSRILLVEDEKNLRKLVATYLKKEMVSVIEAADGKEALVLWEEEQYDLIIVDIMLPEYDGWTICKRIREKSNVPILILTARSEEHDKLFGFDLGVDDYMTKPFSVKELVARVKALLKRSNRQLSTETLIVQGLKVDKKGHQVFLQGERLMLTPKEYDLLLIFLHNQNQALSREVILDGVWGYDYYGDLRTVDTHVKRLRHKLKEMGEQIKTVRGLGYRFEVTK